jgi:ParB/RepB/Spo0J family partition protein
VNVASIQREFKELPLSLIDAPALPSRSAMDDALMDELAVSIRANGLIQPMSVARNGERFEIIAGHRRLRACELAGLVAAPCLIYPSREDALDAIQFAENRHREDLSAADEAIWFSELLDKKCHGDIEKLAGLVGERVGYIDNRLALFRGYPSVFEALQAGTIKIGVAHELNKCDTEQWAKYYLNLAVTGGATVGVVVGWLTEHKRIFSAPPSPGQPAAPSPAGMPVEAHDPFTCVMCRKADNVHLIQTLYVHQHCKLAILDPMLAAYRGES